MNGSLDIYSTELTDGQRALVDELVGYNVQAGADHMAAMGNALGILLRKAIERENVTNALFLMACIERLSFATMAEIALDSGQGGNA